MCVLAWAIVVCLVAARDSAIRQMVGACLHA
ncbi:transcriptional regulator NrdR [Burkholderia pseudomallei MSHR338]|nr:transcriptional regulator NrdR [Burkholderia pseudomallei MSHR338]